MSIPSRGVWKRFSAKNENVHQFIRGMQSVKNENAEFSVRWPRRRNRAPPAVVSPAWGTHTAFSLAVCTGCSWRGELHALLSSWHLCSVVLTGANSQACHNHVITSHHKCHLQKPGLPSCFSWTLSVSWSGVKSGLWLVAVYFFMKPLTVSPFCNCLTVLSCFHYSWVRVFLSVRAFTLLGYYLCI